jgi:hypothetical protein
MPGEKPTLPRPVVRTKGLGHYPFNPSISASPVTEPIKQPRWRLPRIPWRSVALVGLSVGLTLLVLLAYTAHFARSHLPLCVTLRNLQVEGLAAAGPEGVADCFTKAVALQMLARRAEALARTSPAPMAPCR